MSWFVLYAPFKILTGPKPDLKTLTSVIVTFDMPLVTERSTSVLMSDLLWPTRQKLLSGKIIISGGIINGKITKRKIIKFGFSTIIIFLCLPNLLSFGKVSCKFFVFLYCFTRYVIKCDYNEFSDHIFTYLILICTYVSDWMVSLDIPKKQSSKNKVKQHIIVFDLCVTLGRY